MQSNAIIAGLEAVTGRWCKQRKAEERHASARENRYDRMTRRYAMTIKEAAEEVMVAAYNKASANGTLPAHARQVMYAARGRILEITGRESLSDAYFTQKLLPEYIAEHQEAKGWDIVYDARGHFTEPHQHVKQDVPLGTLAVRDYLNEVRHHRVVAEPEAVIAGGNRYPTCGPKDRCSAVLFIEKEGFLPLFEEVKIAERFDLAIMSTKGMSNIASRQLVDTICSSECPLLVVHDFDVAGFTILASLKNSSERYRFGSSIKVIDLGLRLEDVEAYGLESESVYHGREFSTLNMSQAEAQFLQDERVELNAFASDDLIEWLEGKLTKHGVCKVIPKLPTLKDAYRRAVKVHQLNRVIEKSVEDFQNERISIPNDLKRYVERRLGEEPSLPWDHAVAEYVENQDDE